MVAGTAPTGLKDIITRMAKLTEEEIRAIREANDAHYVARPNRRDCVSHRLRVETLRSMVRQEITGNYQHMMGPVQFAEDSLWGFIREEVALQKEQGMKNLHSKHEKTADSNRALDLMSKNKNLMIAIEKINSSRELVALLEAIIDAAKIDKNSVLKALMKVQGHEKKG